MSQEVTVIDFSRKATQSAIVTKTVTHPFFVYPAVCGTLGIVTLLLFEIPALLSFFTIGCFIFGVGSLFINFFFRKQQMANIYIWEIHARFEREGKRKIQKLRREFTMYKEAKGCERYARQAEGQFEKAQDKFEHNKDMLRRKFDPTELTYGMYLGSAEQVYHSVLDNLQAAADFLGSAAGIDPEYIETQMRRLAGLAELEKADEDEKETLIQRKKLREEHLQNVNRLLTLNEQALTGLDTVIGKLAAVKTAPGKASVDSETAIQELAELAKRAHIYSME